MFGVTIDVRMTSASVTWDFGDGTTEDGDLGIAYPAESLVQHTYATDGAFDVSATIALVPEYRIDGGPWITLANLEAQAEAEHAVEERQAVITSSRERGAPPTTLESGPPGRRSAAGFWERRCT